MCKATLKLQDLYDSWVFALNTGMRDALELKALRATIRHHGFNPNDLIACYGMYNGVDERSYIYPVESSQVTSVLKSICRQWEQECIMHIDSTGRCILRYYDGRDAVCIGVLEETTAGVACKHDHTYIPATNQYFIVRSNGNE